MGKLYELIAAEAEISKQYRVIFDGTVKTFKDKQSLFTGSVKSLTMFDDSESNNNATQHKHMEDTVSNQLTFLHSFAARYIDAACQKDATNRLASADIVVEGITIARDVPGITLLGLESKLAEIRSLYALIPTLDVSVEWIPHTELGTDVYQIRHPQITFKTALKFKHQVLVEATEHHRAEIKSWEEQVPVGKYEQRIWSSCMPSANKAELLGRIDNLIVAIKQARQRANDVKVSDVHIGDDLFKYIHNM